MQKGPAVAATTVFKVNHQVNPSVHYCILSERLDK